MATAWLFTIPAAGLLGAIAWGISTFSERAAPSVDRDLDPARSGRVHSVAARAALEGTPEDLDRTDDPVRTSPRRRRTGLR